MYPTGIEQVLEALDRMDGADKRKVIREYLDCLWDVDVEQEFEDRGLEQYRDDSLMLSDCSDEDLVCEAADRGIVTGAEVKKTLDPLMEKFRRGEDISEDLRGVFYSFCGRIA